MIRARCAHVGVVITRVSSHTPAPHTTFGLREKPRRPERNFPSKHSNHLIYRLSTGFGCFVCDSLNLMCVSAPPSSPAEDPRRRAIYGMLMSLN